MREIKKIATCISNLDINKNGLDGANFCLFYDQFTEFLQQIYCNFFIIQAVKGYNIYEY